MAKQQVMLPARVRIKVKPNCSVTKITNWDGKVLAIDVAAPPDKNKANVALLKFLRRRFKKQARIVRGATAREKVVVFD